MSQPNKRDIADFFRPHARTIPRKRPSPGPDAEEDTSVVKSEQSSPRTPSANRTASNGALEQQRPTPTHILTRPLATPTSNRSVHIPIRSPSGGPSLKASPDQRKSVFKLSSWGAKPSQTTETPKPLSSSQQTPKPSSSFTFSDAPSTTRKVVENGKVIEVGDSDDSDNESLEDLSDLIGPKSTSKRGALNTSQSERSSQQEAERKSLLSTFTNGRSNPIIKKDRMRELQRMEQANKFDLSALFAEEKKDRQYREAAEKAKVDLEATAKLTEEAQEADLKIKMLDEIAKGNVEGDVDPQEVARFMRAAERTEAFVQETTFSFFGVRGPRDVSDKSRLKHDLSPSAIPAGLWKPKDTAARDRAFTCGFVTELASWGAVDDEALRWAFDSVLLEGRDDLRQSYIDCISAASSGWTRFNVTPSDVQSMFESLGADNSTLQDGAEIQHTPMLKSEVKRQDYKHLLIALSLLGSICQDMDFASLSKLTSIVSRLSLDERVMVNNLVNLAVSNLLEKLTTLPDSESCRHVHERLLSDLGSNLVEPAFQALFLLHFTPTTSSSARLRSKLASTFFLGEERTTELQRFCTNSSSNITPVTMITNYLAKDPLFTTKSSKSQLTDTNSYAILAARTVILDVLIGDGFCPATFASRPEEQAFNADVDDLANHIHDLFVSIADTGASHMRRTEAKDLLQTLHYRLLWNVRTRQKRKRHIFDAQDGYADGKGKKARLRDAF